MKKFRLLKQSLAFLLSLSMTLGPCAPGLTAARAETISSDYGAGTEDQEAGNSAVDEAAQAYDNDAVGRDSSETEAAEEDNASEQAENVQAASTEQSEAASEGMTFEENQAVDAGEASGLESEADSETVTSENGEIEAASETAAEESAESQAGAEAFSEENEEPTTGATVESAASSLPISRSRTLQLATTKLRVSPVESRRAAFLTWKTLRLRGILPRVPWVAST